MVSKFIRPHPDLCYFKKWNKTEVCRYTSSQHP